MKKKNKELAADTSASVAGALLGLAVAGPTGAVVGAFVTPIFADMGKRMLSPKEVTRLERIEILAVEGIKAEIAIGTPFRDGFESSDVTRKQLEILVEGSFLKARSSYEERKIPFLANLCARAFFTNTPVENLYSALDLADELSYRQLTIVSLYNPFLVSRMSNSSGLSLHSLGSVQSKIGDEYSMGIALDLCELVKKGVLIQLAEDGTTPVAVLAPGNVIPGRLELGYPGRLLHNGLRLGEILESDKEPIIKVLSTSP